MLLACKKATMQLYEGKKRMPNDKPTFESQWDSVVIDSILLTEHLVFTDRNLVTHYSIPLQTPLQHRGRKLSIFKRPRFSAFFLEHHPDPMEKSFGSMPARKQKLEKVG